MGIRHRKIIQTKWVLHIILAHERPTEAYMDRAVRREKASACASGGWREHFVTEFMVGEHWQDGRDRTVRLLVSQEQMVGETFLEFGEISMGVLSLCLIFGSCRSPGICVHESIFLYISETCIKEPVPPKASQGTCYATQSTAFLPISPAPAWSPVLPLGLWKNRHLQLHTSSSLSLSNIVRSRYLRSLETETRHKTSIGHPNYVFHPRVPRLWVFHGAASVGMVCPFYRYLGSSSGTPPGPGEKPSGDSGDLGKPDAAVLLCL
ncbi:hypothetical protein EV421DRAFT_1743330 [Armillaria borealis]|uniref:Uncharacterized protein n=1 Tax=Armillaria borealis TaxID=47425 RepID=A0AA39IVE3_9AGAR|nr:hypothetical protein EV421DRAFT_1743330 [Armillaria borealis]